MTLARQEQSALQTSLEQNACSNIAEKQATESYTKVVNLASGLQVFLITLFIIVGAMAAPVSFASGDDQQLNIFWLLVILLGAHLFSLLLWLISLMTKGRQNSGQLQWFSILLSKIGRVLQVPQPILESYMSLRLSGKAGKWLMARLVHSCWGGYLLGGLCSALLYLMTHQVRFVWETTLLTQQDFYQLTQWLSALPRLVGVPAPSLNDIQMSQIGSAEQSDATRQLWGIWVLACLLIYGVVVRLIFGILSHSLYRQQRKKLWQRIIPSVAKAQYESHIIDPDHHAHDARAPLRTAPTPASVTHDKDASEARHYYLFEWSKPTPASLADMKHVHSINDAAAQQAYLAQPNSHQVLVLDADVSPDRGSLRFIKQAASQTQTIYLYGQTFVDAWTQALQERGIDASTIRLLEDS